MPFQDGDTQRPSTTIQLDVQYRSKGCISVGEHLSGTSALSPLHLDGEHVRIHMLAFWADQHPKGFHQAVEASNGFPERTRKS